MPRKTRTAKFVGEAAKLDARARLELAKGLVDRMINDVIGLLLQHENNRLLLFSPVVASQIPRSFAANAYNALTRCLQEYEVVRVCAFWDNPTWNAENIPSVVVLVDHPDVIALVQEETRAAWLRGSIAIVQNKQAEHEEDVKMAVQKAEQAWADSQGRRARRRLRQAIRVAKTILASDLVWNLMQIRHRRLAHRLSRTHEEIARQQMAVVRNDNAQQLVRHTVSVVKLLHETLNGASFDFAGSQKIARRNALALWSGVSVSVKR